MLIPEESVGCEDIGNEPVPVGHDHVVGVGDGAKQKGAAKGAARQDGAEEDEPDAQAHAKRRREQSITLRVGLPNKPHEQTSGGETLGGLPRGRDREEE